MKLKLVGKGGRVSVQIIFSSVTTKFLLKKNICLRRNFFFQKIVASKNLIFRILKRKTVFSTVKKKVKHNA